MDNYLCLTKEEKSKISKIARSNKFNNAGLNLVYAESNLDHIKNFYKCYRFLVNLCNTDLSGEALDTEPVYINTKNKLKQQVMAIEELALKALKLIEISKSEYALEKLELNERCINFIIDNHTIVFEVLDLVHELGKTIKLYDPDQTSGFY